MQGIDCIQVWLVWQYLGLPEFCWYHLGVDLSSVFSGNVTAHCVVPSECSVTVRAGHTDALMALANVGAQVGLVSIGSLTERAFQLRTWNT